jgi:hypothetical protein
MFGHSMLWCVCVCVLIKYHAICSCPVHLSLLYMVTTDYFNIHPTIKHKTYSAGSGEEYNWHEFSVFQ